MNHILFNQMRKRKAAGGGGTPITWNPADKHTNITLSGGDLTVTNSASLVAGVRGTVAKSTGQHSYEILINSSVNFKNHYIGISQAAISLANTFAYSGTVIWYGNSKAHYKDGINVYTGAWIATIGLYVGVVFDADAGTLTYYHNGILEYQVTGISAGSYFPFDGGRYATSATTNFGQSAFAYPLLATDGWFE